MTIHRWPDTLPTASMPGFGLSPVDQSIRSNMEIGAQRVRRRTTARFDRVTMDWRFTPFQMDAFRTWYEGGVYSQLGASDELTGWTFASTLTRSIGAALSPDNFAVDRVLDVASASIHRADRTVTALAIDNANVQFTASIKAVNRSLGRLTIFDRNGVGKYTEFDLSAGTMAGQSGLTSRSMRDRGNGWWRVTLVANLGVGAANPIFRIQTRDDSGLYIYTGDITKGFDICELSARVATGSDLFLPTEANGTAAGADGGSAWFYLPIATGSALVLLEARFVGPYKATAMTGLNWTVTAEVEVRNA